MGGLALCGLLDRGEATRLSAAADFECLRFHVSFFLVCIEWWEARSSRLPLL